MAEMTNAQVALMAAAQSQGENGGSAWQVKKHADEFLTLLQNNDS